MTVVVGSEDPDEVKARGDPSGKKLALTRRRCVDSARATSHGLRLLESPMHASSVSAMTEIAKVASLWLLEASVTLTFARLARTVSATALAT